VGERGDEEEGVNETLDVYASLVYAGRAAKFVDEIIAHAASALAGEPRNGRTVPEISNPDIRELLFKKYRIMYRVKKNTVEILTLFEGHRLLRVTRSVDRMSLRRDSRGAAVIEQRSLLFLLLFAS
jgi:plasmid stabilization system protein ParE